jgi:hypothetical protein
VVQAFGADGYPGPPSEPSDESFQFLPDVDLDGDSVVGVPDFLRLRRLPRDERADIHVLLTIRRTLGCGVDPASRVYIDCPGGAAAAP